MKERSADVKSDTSLLVFPQKHLTLISLALGFLVIWTAVISVILVSNSLGDNVSANESIEVFNVHKRIAKVVFAIGNELVSTVDWILTNPNEHMLRTVDKSIAITWEMTDAVIASVKSDDSDLPHMDSLLTLIELKLSKLRKSTTKSDVVTVIQSYYDLCDTIQIKLYRVILHAMRDRSIGNDLVLPSISFTFFVGGMSKRFAELAFGTVYVRSDIPLNKSQYFDFHYGSKEFIESAFQLNPRAQNRYWELREENMNAFHALNSIPEDINAGSIKRGDNGLASMFLNAVKDEIGVLIRAKDLLSSSVSKKITHLGSTRQKVFAFHLSIAVIAMVTVISCLALLCCSFRYTGSRKSAHNLNKCDVKASKESIYSLESDDRSQIIPYYHNKQLF